MKFKVYSSWFSTLLLNQYFDINTYNITWMCFSWTLIERFHTMKAQTKMIELALKMKHLLDHGCMIEEDWYLSALNIFFLKISVHTFCFFLYVNESETFWIKKSVIHILTQSELPKYIENNHVHFVQYSAWLFEFYFPCSVSNRFKISWTFKLLEHNLLYFSQFIEFWLWLEGS